jgi:hypothetical protein
VSLSLLFLLLHQLQFFIFQAETKHRDGDNHINDSNSVRAVRTCSLAANSIITPSVKDNI